jgi:hypothetical protein
MRFRRAHLSGLVLAALGALASCEDSTEKPVVVTEKFEGILQTDEDCNILGGDTTDFLPRPEPSDIDTTVFPPHIGPVKNTALAYTCPNPAEQWTTTYFQMSEPDSVWVFVYKEPSGAPVDTLINRYGFAGGYLVTWPMPQGPGIYRIKMFTASGFHSYGDVEFTGGSSAP